MRSTAFLVAVFASSALLLACKPKEESTSPGVSADTAPPVEPTGDDGKDPSKAGINIGPKIAELCNLPATQFAFDSASLSKSSRAALDALAQCFIDGPAAGKSMRLVGHADPRGDEEYNLGLGQRRADNVSGYLSKRGLGSDQVESSSRGELDASGTDEKSWAADRRVDIFLAE